MSRGKGHIGNVVEIVEKDRDEHRDRKLRGLRHALDVLLAAALEHERSNHEIRENVSSLEHFAAGIRDAFDGRMTPDPAPAGAGARIEAADCAVAIEQLCVRVSSNLTGCAAHRDAFETLLAELEGLIPGLKVALPWDPMTEAKRVSRFEARVADLEVDGWKFENAPEEA